MRSLLLLTALFASTTAFAGPDVIPLHGNLRDGQGEPIDGTVTVVFTLEGTTTLWTSTVELEVEQGNFTHYLGDAKPLDLSVFADEPNVFLGITVDGDELPLVELGSVAYAGYAQHAGDAATLQGRTGEEWLAEVPDVADVRDYAADVCYDTK